MLFPLFLLQCMVEMERSKTVAKKKTKEGALLVWIVCLFSDSVLVKGGMMKEWKRIERCVGKCRIGNSIPVLTIMEGRKP